MNDEILFYEEQKFDQLWFKIAVNGSLIPVIAIFLFAVVQQVILKEPFGNNPMSDSALTIVSIIAIFVSLGIIILFQVVKLIVTVTQEGIQIKFYPIINKRIAKGKIEHFEIRKYRPIAEYGGWGIRFSFSGKGKAYNVKGDMGIQFKIQNHSPLLIGTQKPEEFFEALKKIKSLQ